MYVFLSGKTSHFSGPKISTRYTYQQIYNSSLASIYDVCNYIIYIKDGSSLKKKKSGIN